VAWSYPRGRAGQGCGVARADDRVLQTPDTYYPSSRSRGAEPQDWTELENDMIDIKRCPGCAVEKPVTQFPYAANGRPAIECIECTSSATLSVPEKQCSICNTIKPLSGFHRDKWRRDGHDSRCATCVLAARRLRQDSVAWKKLKTVAFPGPQQATKQCSQCRREGTGPKPIAEFSPDYYNSDSLKSWCKEHMNARRRKNAASRVEAAQARKLAAERGSDSIPWPTAPGLFSKLRNLFRRTT
jgi:hypothetical protein